MNNYDLSKIINKCINFINKYMLNNKNIETIIKPIIFISKEPKDFICAICYEKKCNHYFHTSCINIWFKHIFPYISSGLNTYFMS